MSQVRRLVNRPPDHEQPRHVFRGLHRRHTHLPRGALDEAIDVLRRPGIIQQTHPNPIATGEEQLASDPTTPDAAWKSPTPTNNPTPLPSTARIPDWPPPSEIGSDLKISSPPRSAAAPSLTILMLPLTLTLINDKIVVALITGKMRGRRGWVVGLLVVMKSAGGVVYKTCTASSMTFSRNQCRNQV